MKPPTLVWPILANPPWSLVLMIAVSPVAIVISAWISDPVASVAMNESIRITDDDDAVDHPDQDARAEAEQRATAPAERRPTGSAR